jgi:hypothetical protein
MIPTGSTGLKRTMDPCLVRQARRRIWTPGPSELGLPLVECRRTDPVPPASIRCRYTYLLLPQDRDDLLFPEP